MIYLLRRHPEMNNAGITSGNSLPNTLCGHGLHDPNCVSEELALLELVLLEQLPHLFKALVAQHVAVLLFLE